MRSIGSSKLLFEAFPPSFLLLMNVKIPVVLLAAAVAAGNETSIFYFNFHDITKLKR